MSNGITIIDIEKVGEGLFDIHLSNGTVLKDAYLTKWEPAGLPDIDDGSMVVSITISGDHELEKK